jgi:transposase
MLQSFMVPGCRVEDLRRESRSLVVLSARRRRDGARCPDCSHLSGAIHGYYRRRPADLPLCGRQVRLDLQLRRYVCINATCRRRTFAERLPMLLAHRSRRTRRLARAQTQVGVALGGEAGSRLAHRLGMPTSGDTLLRLIRATPAATAAAPTIIGVDDWALKKRTRYGTIIVDLKHRRPIDLLPDRNAETLAAWLQARPGISLVARDRWAEYRRAITAGAPSAVQVADRWHLLCNARQMAERWAAGAYARLQRLPPIALIDSPVAGRTKAFVRTRSAAEVAANSRARRQARYDEVRRRHLAGEGLRTISRATGLARATVGKYARAEIFPERVLRTPAPSIIDPYLPHLEMRVSEGCENGTQLWREVQALGFTGTAKQVRRWLQARRTALHKHTPRRWCDVVLPGATASLPATRKLLAPIQLAWLIVKAAETRSAEEAETIMHIEQDTEAATLVRLVRRFVDLVRDAAITGKRQPPGVDTFDAWLADARDCNVRAVVTFAAGLEYDGAAVRAALTLPWSNGQTEGQVTKLKLLKRSMYGRAKLDLLRQRLLLAA